jgi:hypothetical protein
MSLPCVQRIVTNSSVNAGFTSSRIFTMPGDMTAVAIAASNYLLTSIARRSTGALLPTDAACNDRNP